MKARLPPPLTVARKRCCFMNAIAVSISPFWNRLSRETADCCCSSSSGTIRIDRSAWPSAASAGVTPDLAVEPSTGTSSGKPARAVTLVHPSATRTRTVPDPGARPTSSTSMMSPTGSDPTGGESSATPRRTAAFFTTVNRCPGLTPSTAKPSTNVGCASSSAPARSRKSRFSSAAVAGSRGSV